MKNIFKRLRSSGSFQLIIKLLITIAVFWFVMRNLDFASMMDVLSRQDRKILLVAALLIMAQMVIGAFRWRLIVHGLDATKDKIFSKIAALKIYYISMFFTCCLPGAVGGDVVRVWLAKSEHLSLPVSINSVIIDRMMALIALILMVILTMPVLGKSLGFNAVAVLPFICLAAAFGVWVLFNAERLLMPFRKFRIVHWVLHLVNSIRMIMKNPYACVIALALAFVGQIIYAVCAWVLARSLHIDMTLTQSITLMPPVMLATTLPISIGGWGVREVGIIGLLGLIGIPQGSALILSLQLGLLTVIISLPASLLWIGRRRDYTPAAVTP